MSMFKRINANREERAGLTSKEAPKEQPKETPKDKPKRTMSQAEFSGYAKGGVTKDKAAADTPVTEMVRSRGKLVNRYLRDDAPDAPIRAGVDYGRGLETPKEGKEKRYAKGGMVRGDGCAVKGKTKGRMV